ncbi:phage head-tail joining protein [Sphingomonas parapaucimobilis]|uniref:Uncharacterized protein n=1 Tax=Sphingomonas parapaucimobilis NBRC 15100 TaxID=1219049 RepID=A0A0A1W3S8_9SPHN|nr:hypothetical protein [Sphingomonas parapaucimobilis]GAM00008.1 hypothetical protein SP5_018_00380 [Sphingomonas parapaucimobilis NBRC 15100]
MASLIELQAYRGRLERAVYSGTRRLRDANGEEIEFRSQTELKSALAALERAIAAAHRKSASTIRFQTSKGL